MHTIALTLALLLQSGAPGGQQPPPTPAPPLPMVPLGATGDGLKLSRPTPDFRHEVEIASTSEKPIDITLDQPGQYAGKLRGRLPTLR